MWNITDIKKKGKAALKNNYWGCVLAAFILTVLTLGSSLSGSSGSSSSLENYTEQLGMENLAPVFAMIAAYAFIYAIIWGALRVFLLNILEVGCHSFLKENVDKRASFGEFKRGFGIYKKSMLTMLLRDVFLALWFCLLVIPGIVMSYSYMMVPYILLDEPDLGPREIIKKSSAMMKGHKWKTFLLDLSYIGWMILSLFTFRLVGIFFSEPYRRSARAALYLELKSQS